MYLARRASENRGGAVPFSTFKCFIDAAPAQSAASQTGTSSLFHVGIVRLDRQSSVPALAGALPSLSAGTSLAQ